MYSYCVHGINLKSPIPLKVTEDFISSTDITIQIMEQIPVLPDTARTHILKSSDHEERALICKYQNGGLSIDYFDCGVFYLINKILYVHATHSDKDFFSAILTTQILPLLSSLFRVTLHGGVVVHHQKAALYLGQEGAGKSTLTTHLSQKGYVTLSDDAAAIDDNLTVLPGLPEIRINRDSCQKLLSPHQIKNLKQKLAKQQILISPDNLKPEELSHIFLLKPTASAVSPKRTSLTTSERFLALIENQFRWDVWSSKLLQDEFRMLTILCQKIPMTQLEYPFTYDSLSWVEQQIERSLREPRQDLDYI